MGDFRDWLEEEGITGIAITSTGSVEFYEKPWNRLASEYGIRRMIGFENPEELKNDEYDEEEEEMKKNANRLKTQFFGSK